MHIYLEREREREREREIERDRDRETINRDRKWQRVSVCVCVCVFLTSSCRPRSQWFTCSPVNLQHATSHIYSFIQTLYDCFLSQTIILSFFFFPLLQLPNTHSLIRSFFHSLIITGLSDLMRVCLPLLLNILKKLSEILENWNRVCGMHTILPCSRASTQ